MKFTKIAWFVTAACIGCLVLSGCPLLTGAGDDDADTAGDAATMYSGVQYVIGRGYDVFDLYANPQYIRSAILDYDALVAAGEVENINIDNTEYGTIAGTSSTSYQEELGVSASLSGDFPYFSGSVSSTFLSSTTSNSENQYATIQAKVQKTQYALEHKLDVLTLKLYLTDGFEADINDPTVTTDELFTKYGTHAMVAVILGARYDYNMAARKTDTSSSTAISGYAQASFSSITTEGGFDTSSVNTSAFSTTETQVKAVGGDSKLAAGTSEGFTDWRNSITDDTVVFSNFSQNGLIPIWEFCDDATRSDEIEAAYAAWGAAKQEENVTEPSPTPMGRVTFSLRTFYNYNVSDGTVGDAEWLYKVLLSSDVDDTDHRLSRARTMEEDAITCGKGNLLTFETSYSYRVPLTSTNTFQILPLLEEEDGNDLGISGSDNDRYCTSLSGPRFKFALQDGKLRFTGVDTGTNHYSEGYFSLDSGGMSNDSLSLSLGNSKTFYLVLKQFNEEQPGEWVQFRMTVSWKED